LNDKLILLFKLRITLNEGPAGWKAVLPN